MKQPKAKKIPKYLEIHGDIRQDDYYWLNDRENPDVIAYLEAENAYREEVMAPLNDSKDSLFTEIVGRIRQTDMSVPYISNGYYYYIRFEESAQYPLHCRKQGSLEAPEEILLNVPEMAKGYSYYAAGGLSVSPDNRILAYGVDTVSRRIYTIYFKDLQTGEILPTGIPNTTGNTVWAADNRTVFYQVKDEALRSYKVFRHVVGTDASSDVCVWHETDETFSAFIYKTTSKKYLVIGSSSTVSNEYRILEADNPFGEFRLFQARERDLEFSIDHDGDQFYVIANLEARNFRLMRTSETKTTKENWIEAIPHREDVLLEGLDIFKEWFVLSERKEGITRLRVINRQDFMQFGDSSMRPASQGNLELGAYIDFGETVYMAYSSVNRETDTHQFRLGYTSLTTPNSVFDYDMRSGTLTLLKQEEVMGGGFEVANYQSERVYATARDGVKVPISLVYRKDMFKRNAHSPLLLYAYGSYGHSMDPYFSSPRLSLLDRGFVFAIAHIRGGQEMGRHWYEDGKLLKKMNTFTDFIDCAEHLLAHRYTSKKSLFAMGGSAGGLLMGAIANMRPELWKGIVAQVPFVDVVTTMLDESIPLTTGEFDEWGNPKNKEYYEYIKMYSPYDNVKTQAYPAMLVTTGLHDSQVQYWEPAKWVSKLRVMRTNRAPLLVYCNMETGHGGASGRWDRYKEVAMEYSFLLWLAGKQVKP